MHIIRLILAILTLSQTTHAAQVGLRHAVNPGGMLHMHSRGVLSESNAAQGTNMENAGFDFSTLKEHTMNTLHASLQRRTMLDHCVALHGNLINRMNEAANIGDDVYANLLISEQDLANYAGVIQNFINDYPFIRNIEDKQKSSKRCIKRIIDINILTFHLNLNNLL